MTFLVFVFYKAFTLFDTPMDTIIGLVLIGLDLIFWAVVNVVIACRSIAWSERERIRIHREGRG